MKKVGKVSRFACTDHGSLLANQEGEGLVNECCNATKPNPHNYIYTEVLIKKTKTKTALLSPNN